MAFLLLLHQKIRLQRKQNQLQLKQMRYMSLETRMKNKISKREKYYTKLEQQLERQANYYKNSANMAFSQQLGLGGGYYGLGNPYGSNGATLGVLQNMSKDQMLKALNQYSNGQLDCSKFDEATLKLIKSGGVQEAPCDGDGYKKGDIINAYTGKKVDLPSDVDATQINKAASIMQQVAQMQVSQMQSYATQCKSNYENNVSIWLDAQKEQLDAQREWEMDLLSEEQADIEADKLSNDAEIEMIKNQLQAIEQALPKAIQDSAPKFGLG